jgi:glutathione reductase (NADPH)
VLVNAGVQIYRSRATVLGPHAVEVDGKKRTAKHVLVATGSWPTLPVIPGIEHAITSNEAFHLERLPKRAVVVGGGYIALEFASIFHGLGVDTMLTYRGKRLLRGFDAEIGARIAEEMAAKGVNVCFGCEPAALRKDEKRHGPITIEFTDGRIEQADLVMFATGRRPNTAKLGLEAAGVKLAADGAVVVDKYSTSSVPSIHAIGDVTNRINLTPVATAEAMWLARTLFRDEPTEVDHANVATAVFSNPNLATVGLSEEKARERYGAIDIYKASFRALKLTMTEKSERTFMKLVVDRATQRVVGAHMIGADAGEIIQGIAIAVKLGATKAQFDATIGIHPTGAEEFVTMRDQAT